MGGMTSDFPISDLLKELDTLMSQLRALEMSSRIRLSDDILNATTDDIWTDAARHFFRPIIKSRCSLGEVIESL